MGWINSLTPEDVVELKELRDRAPDSESFFNYIILMLTIRAHGPVPPSEMAPDEDQVWKDLYSDQFELRSDGNVHLKRTLALVS